MTVRGAVGPDGNPGLAGVVKLGAEHGFQFSEADVMSVFSNDNDELSDFELEMVAAGNENRSGQTFESMTGLVDGQDCWSAYRK